MKNSTIARIFNVARQMAANNNKKHDPRKSRRYARAIVASTDDRSDDCYLQALSALKYSKSLARFMKAVSVCPFLAAGISTARINCEQVDVDVFAKIRDVKFFLRHVSRKSRAGLTLQGELVYYQYYAEAGKS